LFGTNWRKVNQDSVSIDEISSKFSVDPNLLKSVSLKYPFKLNRYYFSLIKDIGDPIWIQAVPDPRELECSDILKDDPFLEDSKLSPLPGLVHRYKDRVILLVTGKCAMYCRHCMRKRRTGLTENNFFDRFDDILYYLKEHKDVFDVIISGGDPFLLDDDRIEFLLSEIKKVRSDIIIRIHTRTPVTLPQRITPELCTILSRYNPLYINTHFNHFREITEQSSLAVSRMSDTGIPLGCQTVLLKGVNDDFKTISKLFSSLLKIRVKPYYLHHPDPVQGTEHLRPDVETGLELMKNLRGRISGMAIPYYMIDLPGGKGKVPILPEYIEKKEDKFLVVKNYMDKRVVYPL